MQRTEVLLTLSAKTATSFFSINIPVKFSFCTVETTMTSNASMILSLGNNLSVLCNHADSNLACMNTDLEEVVLVTLTGHVETLSIICTTSTVICSQKESMLICSHTSSGNFGLKLLQTVSYTFQN